MLIASDLNAPRNRSPEENRRPWKNGEEEDGSVVPEGLDVLEFGGEVAFEVVLDDEDAEEVGVAAGAEDVPRQSRCAERGERGWMKEAEGVSPALGEERPEEDRAAAEDYRGGALGEHRQSEEKTEENRRQPGRI